MVTLCGWGPKGGTGRKKQKKNWHEGAGAIFEGVAHRSLSTLTSAQGGCQGEAGALLRGSGGGRKRGSSRDNAHSGISSKGHPESPRGRTSDRRMRRSRFSPWVGIRCPARNRDNARFLRTFISRNPLRPARVKAATINPMGWTWRQARFLEFARSSQQIRRGALTKTLKHRRRFGNGPKVLGEWPDSDRSWRKGGEFVRKLTSGDGGPFPRRSPIFRRKRGRVRRRERLPRLQCGCVARRWTRAAKQDRENG